MRWPLPLLLMVLTGCSTGPSKEAIAIRNQLAREAEGIHNVIAKAKITTTSADGLTTVRFHANCYFIRGGILRIVPLEFGIGVFDAIAVDSGIMTQVVGEQTEGKLTDMAFETVEPLSWWVPMPVSMLKSAKIKESPGQMTLTTQEATILIDSSGGQILQYSRDGQTIAFERFVTIHNEAAASYKSEVPESYRYPSLITIRTPKVTATLELSDIRINAPVPAGTLPKAFEDLAK